MEIIRKPRSSRVMDLTGHVYGHWVVLSYAGAVLYKKSKGHQQMWLCRCKCGARAEVQASALRGGTSTQCRDCHSERHGMKKHPLYSTWLGIRNRCSNPGNASYDDYGGLGISVCERWNSFPLFVADVGERPYGKILDRIDGDGDYEPGNVRWATYAEQAANRRRWGISRRKWKEKLI